jgi:hypothetical protein
MTCTNCNAEVISKFCPDCGQPKNLKRIDGHYILHEIEHVLHFERGILYTIKELLISPGKSIRKYLAENRSRLIKPIVFIILTSLIYTLISHFFHIEDELVTHNGLGTSKVGTILQWSQNNYGYSSILTGIFIAPWLKLFYKKYDFNYYELIIMLCFIQGISMLFYAVFALIQGITHFNIINFAGILGFGYMSFAIGNFYEPRKFKNYFKAFVSIILGVLTFTIAIVIVGVTFDFILKK